MATTYALPAVNGPSGHGHSHSNGRKPATERLPLRPTSTNGGVHVNSGPISSDVLKPQVQHQPHKPLDVFQHSNQQSYNSNQQRPNSLHLPTPTSFSTPTIARSKSMERRKSVGLPTHLRLERNAYGFPPPSSQRFPKIDEHVGTRYTSQSCMIFAWTALTRAAQIGRSSASFSVRYSCLYHMSLPP